MLGPPEPELPAPDIDELLGGTTMALGSICSYQTAARTSSPICFNSARASCAWATSARPLLVART
jgi:hypothetical protein